MNGREVAKALRGGRVEGVTVALNAGTGEEYESSMVREEDKDALARLGRPVFSVVTDFVRACVSEGLDVEATCVDRPGADVAAVTALARELGVSRPVKVRSWHP